MSIPDQVGRFDDSFNPNCTGDQYSLLGTPTILIESGFYPEDYTREQTRRYVAEAIFRGIEYINDTEVTGEGYAPYFDIPENKKSYALSFELLNEEKTLEDKEITEVMDKIIKIFETKFQANLR